MLSEGSDAAAFKLPGTTGGQEFREYRLTDLTEAGPVILAFYPFDFSPICTTELCKFRDAEWLTLTEAVDVLGISRDSCYAHSRFIEEYNLSFPLLSDIEGDIVEKYGVKYDEWEEHQGVAKRAIFVINTDETIEYMWRTEDAYEHPDMQEIANVVREIPTTDPGGE